MVEVSRHWVEIKNRPCVSLFGLSWDPGCTKSHSYNFLWFFSPPCLLLPNVHFCFAQCSVQGQAVGFLHSGVLITGSHVSCSHLSPPLPHLFIFSSTDIHSLSLSEHMDRCLREIPVHIKDWDWAGQFVAPFPNSSPPLTSVDPPCTTTIYPECSIAQAVLPNIYSISSHVLLLCVCSPHIVELIHFSALNFSHTTNM